MKLRDIALMAVVILGIYSIVQGFSSFGTFFTQTFSGRIILRDEMRRLGPLLLISLLFSFLPGILIIFYRNRIVRFIFPSAPDGEPIVTAFGADDLLRIGLVLIGAVAMYTGLVTISSSVVFLVVEKSSKIFSNPGGWDRFTTVPFVLGLIHVAIGYLLVFHTNDLMKFIHERQERPNPKDQIPGPSEDSGELRD